MASEAAAVPIPGLIDDIELFTEQAVESQPAPAVSEDTLVTLETERINQLVGSMERNEETVILDGFVPTASARQTLQIGEQLFFCSFDSELGAAINIFKGLPGRKRRVLPYVPVTDIRLSWTDQADVRDCIKAISRPKYLKLFDRKSGVINLPVPLAQKPEDWEEEPQVAMTQRWLNDCLVNGILQYKWVNKSYPRRPRALKTALAFSALEGSGVGYAANTAFGGRALLGAATAGALVIGSGALILTRDRDRRMVAWADDRMDDGRAVTKALNGMSTETQKNLVRLIPGELLQDVEFPAIA